MSEPNAAPTSSGGFGRIVSLVVQLILGFLCLLFVLKGIATLFAGNAGGLVLAAIGGVFGYVLVGLRRAYKARWTGRLSDSFRRPIRTDSAAAPRNRAGGLSAGPAKPLTQAQKVFGTGAIALGFVVAAVLALVATVAGSAVADHYRPLDAACNGAYQSGLANSTSDNVHCSLDTTLYSLGSFFHTAGFVALIVVGLGFIGMMALAPAIRADFKRLGRW